MRDDFSKQTVTELAKGVDYRCSNPECQRATAVVVTGEPPTLTAAMPAAVGPEVWMMPALLAVTLPIAVASGADRVLAEDIRDPIRATAELDFIENGRGISGWDGCERLVRCGTPHWRDRG